MRGSVELTRFTRRQRFGYWLVRRLSALQEWIYRRVIQDDVWCSSDGRVTPVREMDARHLRNAYRLLRRERGQPDKEAMLRAELERRQSILVGEKAVLRAEVAELERQQSIQEG